MDREQERRERREGEEEKRVEGEEGDGRRESYKERRTEARRAALESPRDGRLC